jgi:hypothetical protein
MYASQRQRRFDRSPTDPSRRPLEASMSPSIGHSPPPGVSRRKVNEGGHDFATGEDVRQDEFEMQPQSPPKGPRAAPGGFGRYEAYQGGQEPTLPNVPMKENITVRENRLRTPPGGGDSPMRKPGMI